VQAPHRPDCLGEQAQVFVADVAVTRFVHVPRIRQLNGGANC
jgi:hypothetical protein